MRPAAWLGLVAATLLVPQAGRLPLARASHTVSAADTSRRFQTAAAGARAAQDAVWRIAVGPEGMGLVVSAALCGDDAFLLDRQRALIHRVDLRGGGAITGELGRTAGGGIFRAPSALAADCAERRLYVVDDAGATALDAQSGAVVRRYPRTAAITNSIGAAILDAGAQALYAPGLWSPPPPLLGPAPLETMFEGAGIGVHLDLRTGAASRLMPALDRGCRSLGPNCNFVTLDRLRTPASGWIAAHRVGTTVGVFDDEGRLVRRIDVRSPRFLDSRESNRSRSLTDMVAWNEHNSVIRAVFAFGDTIATIHSVNRTRGWRPGQQTDFDVLMNLHASDGRGLTSDLQLPGLPVGRDVTSLYVVDYGAAGRRPLGRDPVTLIRVPIDPARAARAE